MISNTDCISAAFKGRLGDFSLNISFETRLRGITALFGVSGCGKTSTLMCIAGLMRQNGYLKVGDDVWQDDSNGNFLVPHKRSIGFVFQEPSLFAHLSVHKNLIFGAKRAQKKNIGIKITVDEIIDLLGISHLLDRMPEVLSGGERQRVAVGRALLSQPRLLLMDEPLSSLDQVSKDEILPYFEALHVQLSIPILYVSHDISEVTRLADQMIVMSQGKNLAQGPVNEVLERLDLQSETDPFEAGALLSARVIKHNKQFCLTHLDHHGQVISIPAQDLPLGSNVRLRIRARDVSLATQFPMGISIRNILSGTILEITQMSSTPFVEVLLDLGGGRLRARITRQSLADLDLKTGMSVFALIKSIVFDGKTSMLFSSCTEKST